MIMAITHKKDKALYSPASTLDKNKLVREELRKRETRRTATNL